MSLHGGGSSGALRTASAATVMCRAAAGSPDYAMRKTTTEMALAGRSVAFS